MRHRFLPMPFVLFSRLVQHGQRRAEAIRESANTVREAGIEPLMATAIATRHQRVADQDRAGVFAGVDKAAPWQDCADRLLAARQNITTCRPATRLK